MLLVELKTDEGPRGYGEAFGPPLHRARWAADQGVSTAAMRARWLAAYPQKRFIRPEEAAAVAAFFCTAEAGAITGEDIAVTTGASF